MAKLSRRAFLTGAAAAAAGGYLTYRLATRAPSVSQVRYRLRRRDGAWTKPLSKTDVLAALRGRASKHPGPYRLRRWCDDCTWGKPRELSAILERLREVLPKVHVGTTYSVKADADDGVIWDLRKVEVDLSCTTDTQGTPAIDRIYCTVAKLFDGVESWGICACRRVRGGTSWSQHAWCNAWDIHHDDPAVMQRIADFLVANAYALDVVTVIYRDRIWTRAEGWHAYGGVYHGDHVHVEGYPLMTGTPPCAR